MLSTKFCCEGLHATIIQPLFPMTRERNGKSVKFYTALYKCRKCGGLTLRGESNQPINNTLVEYVTEEQRTELLEERRIYELAKSTSSAVQGSQT